MNLSIQPVGRGATGAFTLENKSDDVVPIEATVVQRILDLDGKETTGPIDKLDKFVIYPPMISLKPHESRTIKVMYAGPQTVLVEKAYRFFVSQLPLNNYRKNKGKNVLDILMRYGASLYVTPLENQSDVSILDARYVDQLDSNNKKQQKLLLTFINKGNAHQNLTNYNIKILGTSKSYTIPWSEVQKLVGPLNVFAKQKRRVFIPWDSEFPHGSIKGEIQSLD